MSAQRRSEDEGFGKPARPHDESVTGTERRLRERVLHGAGTSGSYHGHVVEYTVNLHFHLQEEK